MRNLSSHLKSFELNEFKSDRKVGFYQLKKYLVKLRFASHAMQGSGKVFDLHLHLGKVFEASSAYLAIARI